MSLGAVKIAEDAMCQCTSEFGYAEVVKGQTSTSAITGMTDDETAVLAGVLAGLATFLFLALPLLCCLCPLPFACCGGGGGKKKAAAAAAAAGAQKRKNIHEFSSGRSTDVESIGSYRSWDKNWDKLDRFDHDNLYEVDMKLPRVWLETLRGVPDDEVETRLRELTRDGGWEGGNDVHDVNMGKQMSEMEMRREMYEESGSGGMGTDGGRYASVQRMDGSGGGGEELIAEYEISRHITMDTTRMTLPETEYIYERDIRGDSSIADRDNFKRVYYTYQRIKGDDSKQTSF